MVVDAEDGPVWIGDNVTILPHSYIQGPAYIGNGTLIQPGAVVHAGTTIGPHCRVGGEVECSVMLGYANKYHEGFLGHSYVGEWVNLAAGTITGDLRFDYRPVSVAFDDADISTGRTKIGSLIGDHAKTGLGALLDCGTTLGCFAQVLPTGTLAPRSVPSFHRAGPDGLKPLSADRLLETADVVMRRGGRVLTRPLEAVYRAIAGAPAADVPITIRLRKSA